MRAEFSPLWVSLVSLHEWVGTVGLRLGPSQRSELPLPPFNTTLRPRACFSMVLAMSPVPSAPTQLLVFTDLDGTLLDAITYSWTAARDALETLRRQRIPLILVSSKTRAEIEALRVDLDHRHPFVVENGGALFIPEGYFRAATPQTPTRNGYEVIELGTSYETLRQALGEIAHVVGVPLRGFHDMTIEEVAERTGLSTEDAELAMEREYDEPFLVEGQTALLPSIQREAQERGLTITRGGRFHHLLGESDKGRACLHLLDRYSHEWQDPPRRIASIGLGDSANDLSMLQMVDYPVVVQHPDGSYDPSLHLSTLHRADGIGPVGWNRAVLDLIKTEPTPP